MRYFTASIAGLILFTASARAGVGPQNVIIVVNDNSRESLELGHYCQAMRGVNERQIVHVSTTTNDTITLTLFTSEIYTPVTIAISARGLSSQIDTIVYTRGMPYQVTNGFRINSITSATDYGFKNYPNPVTVQCTLPNSTSNLHFAAERDFSPADDDFDGLPDDWEEFYFGDTSPTAADDPDSDGMNHLGEYIADTRPNDGGSRFTVNDLSGVETNAAAIRFVSSPARTYSVQVHDGSLTEPSLWLPGLPDLFPGAPGVTTWVDTNAPPAGPARAIRIRAHAP